MVATIIAEMAMNAPRAKMSLGLNLFYMKEPITLKKDWMVNESGMMISPLFEIAFGSFFQ